MTAEVEAPPRRRSPRPARDTTVPLPPLSPRAQLLRVVFVLLAVSCGALVLQLAVLSGFQERAAQQNAYDTFRAELAKGTAPVAQVDDENKALRPGTPMAYLEIPAIGLRQVVLEGTTSGVLFDGPGHRRDSPFPGAPGTTVILGRRATYGGPFSNIGDLQEGDAIRVTTGAGEFDYEVIGVRREGEPAPPALEAGKGRMLLITADGRPYVPDGVLRVDAELTSTPLSGGSPAYTSKTLPDADAIMASDTADLWALALWLQALLVASVAFVWAWFRWGRARAWIVGFPLLLVVGLMVANQVARLLPNLL
jgi:LPXTG-site transpeptidase (sortase) family protein